MNEQSLIRGLKESGIPTKYVKRIIVYIQFLEFQDQQFRNSLLNKKAVPIEEIRKMTARLAPFIPLMLDK